MIEPNLLNNSGTPTEKSSAQAVKNEKLFLNLWKNYKLWVGILMAAAGIYFIQAYNSNPAEKVLRNYLKAKSWELRLPYVRKPEAVKPLMNEYYKGIDFSVGKPFLRLEPSKDANINNIKVGDWLSIKAVFEEGKNAFGVVVQDSTWYSLQLTESGFKIDWEASVVYNPMTFKAMNAQKPTFAQKFRVFAELGNYYNYEFRDSQYYFYSINLVESGGHDRLHGYIKKDSKDGARIYELLKDGESHPVIVKIRFPEFSRGSEQVIIDEFVQEYFNESN